MAMSTSMKEKLARIAALPQGLTSPSGHYWCATCKKLFQLETPTCPYMTNMCVNNLIPAEAVAPPHPIAYERFGLFYPKAPQRAMARLATAVKEPQALGEAWAQAYLDDLKTWKVNPQNDPVETLKAFVIFISGCEVAQRLLDDELLFIILDPRNVWAETEKLRTILEAGLTHLRSVLAFPRPITIRFIEIVPGQPGRYFCPKCRMYFEFGKAREKVICPLMPQKCMFDPLAIQGTYPLADLIKIYRITPALYRRLIEAARPLSQAKLAEVRATFDAEIRSWGFDGSEAEWATLHEQLGL